MEEQKKPESPLVNEKPDKFESKSALQTEKLRSKLIRKALNIKNIKY